MAVDDNGGREFRKVRSQVCRRRLVRHATLNEAALIITAVSVPEIYTFECLDVTALGALLTHTVRLCFLRVTVRRTRKDFSVSRIAIIDSSADNADMLWVAPEEGARKVGVSR
jgi:hypothetical protein